MKDRVTNFVILLLCVKPFFELFQTVRLGFIDPRFTPLRLLSAFIVLLLLLLVIARLRSTRGSFAFTILILVSGLSGALLVLDDSSNLLGAAQAWLRLSGNFVVFWFFAISRISHKELFGLVWKLLAAYSVAAVVNLVAFLTGRATVHETSLSVDRVAGVLHDAGGLAVIGFLVVSLALIVWDQAKDDPRFKNFRTVLLGLVGMGGVLVTISMTRSVILATAVFVGLWSWRRGGGRWQRVGLMLGLAVVAFFLAIPIFLPRIAQDMELAREGLTDQDTLRRAGSGRIGVWLDLIDRLMERDLLETLIGDGTMLNAHNQWLSLWWQCGLLGTLAFTLGMLSLVTQLYRFRHWPIGGGAYAGIMALLVNSLFLATFNFSYSWAFMALGGGVISLAERAQREQQIAYRRAKHRRAADRVRSAAGG